MEEKMIIYLEIDEDDMASGMDAISFVDKPATEITWNKFNEHQKKHVFKDQYKKVVTAPVMVAETPIYRNSPTLGEYYTKFSAETIFKMMVKYFKENKINRVNEQHNSKRIVKDAFLVESFIVGERVQSTLYPDVPEGTWMASFYIQDDNYWDNVIMKDKFGGFSLEGYFIENFEANKINKMHSQIEKILNECTTEEDKFERIKAILTTN